MVFAYDGRGLMSHNPEQLCTPTALALSRFALPPIPQCQLVSWNDGFTREATRFRRVFARHPRERAETSSPETSSPSLVVRVAPLRCREVRSAAYVSTLTIAL